MELFYRRYRSITVWISLIILLLFVRGLTETENRNLSLVLALFAGSALFATGCVRAYRNGSKSIFLVELILTVFFFVGWILETLTLGGIL